jgi:hypothetical protein
LEREGDAKESYLCGKGVRIYSNLGMAWLVCRVVRRGSDETWDV